ncbi:MAG: tRNA (adenosine(37)-N6)-threonylcarbamoyltransferase complex ATPase subunit type 1 TsaE [Acidimicrobiia bacterium]|nr:tRNA (adenosine(37)-N6)-threonylcarbamoyltransferase complex ATPase subunit type 1 TsaE [Acidimicrobiia bacterium]
MNTIVCTTASETRAVGRRLASLMRAGDIVLLAGDLGAGKTVFAAGIAEGLGVEDPVMSPSFVLVRRYSGLLSMVHADLYRVGSSGEIEDLDLASDAAEGVLVVEWGDVSEQSFGDDLLMVRITVDDDGVRTLHLQPRGAWLSRPLGEVAG